jgi:hypothetical protein
MLYKRAKPLNAIFTRDGTTFPIVMAITFAMVLFIPMTFTTPHRGLGPDLPRVDHPIQMPDAERADAMVVGITRQKRIYFGIEQVTADELPGQNPAAAQPWREEKDLHAGPMVECGTAESVLLWMRRVLE